MVEYTNQRELTELFKSLSDPTRRSLITLLCQEGPCRVTDIAGHYDLSLNAISKHLKVLENAALVTRRTEGRDHWIEADLQAVHALEAWLGELRSIWALRLDRLATILNEEAQDE